ncbi:MAG: cysteine desulfurase family protein [candidate division KSB1 bacterium]|nr:cysteine desulfurase family protein [candidate division KSB1 bacterium]MDQ7065755.1 cysteine desulfurase family protein [candidate division KSB1 bacterium]
MKRIYLDYAATTPVEPEVVEVMLPYFRQQFGNASSIHRFGLEAKKELDHARGILARALNAEPREIVFTGGGTEANNLALLGTVFRSDAPGHLITSSIEHPSVRRTCEYLQKKGWRVTFLRVDAFGMVHPEELEKAIQPDTRLISIMYVNNEVGTINPIKALAEIAKKHGIPFHTDAVQAFAKLKIDVREVPVSMLSLAAHKIYGPKGVGALYVRRGVPLQSVLIGGSQEFALRPGTENLPGIVGLAKAVEIYERRREQDWQHIQALADWLLERLREEIPEAVLNGHPEQRYPGVLNLSFPGLENMALVMGLDLEGIAVSNGSACSSGKVEPSHVLQAMRLPRSVQQSAIRISLGRYTTREEVEHLIAALKKLTQNKIKAGRS